MFSEKNAMNLVGWQRDQMNQRGKTEKIVDINRYYCFKNLKRKIEIYRNSFQEIKTLELTFHSFSVI